MAELIAGRGRGATLAGVAVLAAVLGCCQGGARAGTQFSDAGSLPLTRAPARLVRLCHIAGAHTSFPRRCATRFLRGPRIDAHSQQFPGSDQFSYEALFSGVAGVGTPHLILGGQARPLGVTARRGSRTVASLRLDARLGLPKTVEVLGSARVGSRPALVIRVSKRRPSRNSGHVVVLWNAGSHGWLVSVHLERLSLARRAATAIAIARSVRAG